MLSGVGPADDLRHVGIECRQDLPGVGANLHDHPQAPTIFECTRPITLDTAETPWNFLRYILFKSGPLTSNVAEAGAFVRSGPAVDRPDLQLHFAPAFFHRHGLSVEKRVACCLGFALIQPQSRGTLRLRSADPFAAPLIDPNYLSSEQDVAALVVATKTARSIVAQPAFDAYRGAEFLPGEAVRSDEELARHVREHCETLYHPVGTCKMGLGSTAVVDPQLRVRGIDGLRVADASIMPKIVGGNTNAAAILIGGRAAEFIISGDAGPAQGAMSARALAG
jgi:choline dehydrogenase